MASEKVAQIDECRSNVYILNGFAELVFAVCVSPRPNLDGNSQNDSQPITPLSRIKKAESELRCSSILVFVDVEKEELFSFIRKVDIKKDGKAIFTRLSTVMRANSCHFTQKHQPKASELLKNQQSRPYRFLMAAVMGAIRPTILSSGKFIQIDIWTFASVPGGSPLDGLKETSSEDDEGVNLHRFELQLYENGQLSITVLSKSVGHMRSIESLVSTELGTDLTISPRAVILSPIGQTARYTGGRIGKLPEISSTSDYSEVNFVDQREKNLEVARQKIWKSKFIKWLQDQGCTERSESDGLWVEIEIPIVSDVVFGKMNMLDNSPSWEATYWPASLAFSMTGTRTSAPDASNDTDLVQEDPLVFVQDWLLSAEQRETNLQTTQNASGRHSSEIEDHWQTLDMSDDDLGFSVIPFPDFVPTELPPSHAMYPTPPDGALMQQTPGMSSIDGIGMTPAGPFHTAADEGRDDVAEQEMRDIDAADGAGVGSGFYDEDLFEDMPDTKYENAGGADEPNWDFFDHQDFAMPDIEVAERANSAGGASFPDDAGQGLSSLNTSSHQTTFLQGFPDQGIGKSREIEMEDLTPGPKLETSHTAPEESTGVSIQEGEDLPNRSPLMSSAIGAVQVHATRILGRQQDPPGTLIRRRSQYSSLDIGGHSNSFDARYDSTGKFWFDSVLENRESRVGASSETHLRPLSSNSVHPSDSSGDPTMSDDEEPATSPLVDTYKVWTNYVPVTPEDKSSGPSSAEMKTLEKGIEKNFDALQLGASQNSLSFDVLERLPQLKISKSTLPEDTIMISQLLIEQLAQSCLDHGVDALSPPSKDRPDSIDILGKLQAVYGYATKASLEELTRLGANQEDESSSSNIAKLGPGQVTLRRSDKPFTAQWTILPFWDNLNLQPKSGTKNVISFCLYPEGTNISRGCKSLMDRMNETYASCSLGTHKPGFLAGLTKDGLVSWSESSTKRSQLQQMCKRLGTALALLPSSADIVLIYMINSSPTPDNFVTLCGAFCTLFKSYAEASESQTPHEVVLQIVPLDFVASPDTITVRTQAEYLHLALEVYGRCPGQSIESQLASSDSAIAVAEPAHRTINFELKVEHQSPLDDNSHDLHLVYSQSPDRRWMTAAWTDSHGHIALTTPYCIRAPGSGQSRPRAEIIKEMWEVSQDIMNKTRSRWRLIVAKTDMPEIEEINEWTFFTNFPPTDKGPERCFLEFIYVDLNPPLVLDAPLSHPKAPMVNTPQQFNNPGTPVSTPQGSATSPDQLLAATPTPGGSATIVNAPTPQDLGFDPNTEADLALLDPTEESWSVILSPGVGRVQRKGKAPAVAASGLLLKRKGIKDGSDLAVLGVHLVHTSVADQGPREDLLKGIISQYRSLSMLGSVRGVNDGTHEVVPWHVACAIKSERVLSQMM